MVAGVAKALSELVEQVQPLLAEPCQQDAVVRGDDAGGEVGFNALLSDGVEGLTGEYGADTVCRSRKALHFVQYCK